jgi:GAF domain
MCLAGSWLQRVLRACEHDARCRTTEALLCIGQIAPRGMDLEDLLEVVVNAVYYFTDAHRVNLFMVDELCEELWCAKSRDIDGVTLPLGHGLCGTAAATGCIVNVADCYADERFDPVHDLDTAYQTRSMLCMPVPPPEPGHDLVSHSCHCVCFYCELLILSVRIHTHTHYSLIHTHTLVHTVCAHCIHCTHRTCTRVSVGLTELYPGCHDEATMRC